MSFKFKKGYSLTGKYNMNFSHSFVMKNHQVGYIFMNNYAITTTNNIQIYMDSDSMEFEDIFIRTNNMVINRNRFNEWLPYYQEGSLVIIDEKAFGYIQNEIYNDIWFKNNLDQILNQRSSVDFDVFIDNIREVDYLEFKDPVTGRSEQFIITGTVVVNDIELPDNHRFNQYIEYLSKYDDTLKHMDLSVVRDVDTGELYVKGIGEGMDGHAICFDEDFIKQRLKEKEVAFINEDPTDVGKQLNESNPLYADPDKDRDKELVSDDELEHRIIEDNTVIQEEEEFELEF